jgi:hypothetical protein
MDALPEQGLPFRALVLLFLPTFFLLLLPQGVGRPATASSADSVLRHQRLPSGSSAAGDCSAQLFAAAAAAAQVQQQQQDVLLPQPALTLLSSDAATTCLLLTLPQRPAQPTACRQTVSGTWPDDFELRLGRTGSATESRTLPIEALLQLLPSSSAAASHYSVALPRALLLAFAAGAPAEPTSIAANAASAPLLLDLYVYSSAYDWEVQAGEPCSPSSARTAPEIGRATLELPSLGLAPLPPATQQQEQPLPRCTSASAPGRWLPSAAAAALARGPGLESSGEGRSWVSDALDCSLRPFSGEQAQSCLAVRFPPSSLLLYLGDSNIRRDFKTLKGLLAAGNGSDSAWCAARRNDNVCLCSDSEERGEYDGNFGASFSASSGGFSVKYFFIPGIHPANENEMSTWRPVLFDNILSLVRAGQRVGAIVFTLVHWEVAFDEFWAYAAELEAFAAALSDLGEEHDRAAAAAAESGSGSSDPPQPLLFVYRRPNYKQFQASPGAAAEPGRFETHGLGSLYARAADDALARALGNRLLVWDVTVLQQSKPWEAWHAHHDLCQDRGLSQHPASEDHEVALQLLLHGLCAGQAV